MSILGQPTQNANTEEHPLKHTRLGIASCVLSIILTVLLVASIQWFRIELRRGNGEVIAILCPLVLFWLSIAYLLPLALGGVGLIMKRRRKKIFAYIGIGLSATMLILVMASSFILLVS